jgi:hypothetical protein
MNRKAQCATEALPGRGLSGIVALQLLLAAQSGICYEDGAPPGHTAGFGEPDCSLCHSDGDRNPPNGTLRVDGVPECYVGNAEYELAVVLEHPDLRSGGFQLAIRSADGEPAGRVIPVSARARVVAQAGQDYLQHSKDGRKPEREGMIRWAFRWIAPPAAGPLLLHIAANAANDDISALGDFIFTLETMLEKACH